MADRKISDLTALTAPAAGDYLPIVDISEVSAANKNKRITIEELLRGAPDGTAAAPSIGFESDPNTGLFRVGADQLGIATNGTERLRIDSAGQIEAVSLGTAAAPTWSYTGDPNTGSFSPGADIWAISTGGTERARIDSSGRLLVGTSTARSALGVTSAFQVEGTGYDTSSLSLICNANSPGIASNLILGKSRGTSLGSNSVVQSGDTIGDIAFAGADGSDLGQYAAKISAEVDGTPGANDMPGRLVFSTTADGASSPTERLRLTSAGLFQSMPIYNTTGGDAANVVVNAAGTVYRSTSSAKYKTDIETLQDQYADAILTLRPVWYRSTCEIDNPDWSYWGFIAEEVAEIDPRLVSWKISESSYDENGAVVHTQLETPEAEGVQYDRFVPHLLNLIKRQKEQIEAMEARLTALEAV